MASKIECLHRGDKLKHVYVCKLGLYKGQVTDGMCRKCISKNQNNEEYAKATVKKSSGLGDLIHSLAQPVAKTIDATLGTNIQNCGGCQKRRNKLNEMFPIKIE